MCVCVCGGGGTKLDQGGELDQKSGGGGNWPKVVLLFLVQGEKCVWGGGDMALCPPSPSLPLLSLMNIYICRFEDRCISLSAPPDHMLLRLVRVVQ